jgi:hypothetical protein
VLFRIVKQIFGIYSPGQKRGFSPDRACGRVKVDFEPSCALYGSMAQDVTFLNKKI